LLRSVVNNDSGSATAKSYGSYRSGSGSATLLQLPKEVNKMLLCITRLTCRGPGSRSVARWTRTGPYAPSWRRNSTPSPSPSPSAASSTIPRTVFRWAAAFLSARETRGQRVLLLYLLLCQLCGRDQKNINIETMKNFHQDTSCPLLCRGELGISWLCIVFNSALLISSQCLLFPPTSALYLWGLLTFCIGTY